MAFSSVAEVDYALRTARQAFESGKTRQKEWRRLQLQKAWWMIEDNKIRIFRALHHDLHKHELESIMTEAVACQFELSRALANLDRWTADEHPGRLNPLNFIGGLTVRKEPKGVVLIIGAWNFPFTLLMHPLAAALTAGCAVILKPSDIASAAQDLLMDIIPKYMDPEAIHCISAGPKEMGLILNQRFDHIFYTGSARVGKIIAMSAARQLTPVTLELGGQNPAIVTASANVALAAKRIASSKTTNAGQICLSVNHALVAPSMRQEFVSHLVSSFNIFMGGSRAVPDYYTHIVNDQNFDRLEHLLDQTKGTIVYAGPRNRSTRFFGPVIVVDVHPGDALLSQELFGPILPVVDADLDKAISITGSMDHSLCLYAFMTQKSEKDRILAETTSGGVTFNDWLFHATSMDAPFGGVGKSGFGRYHGVSGFLEFTNLRSFIDLPMWLESVMSPRYPPYTSRNAWLLEFLTFSKATFDRHGKSRSSPGPWIAAGVACIAIVILWCYLLRDQL